VRSLNDYVRGAFEALSWTHVLLVNIDSKKDPVGHLDKAIREVEAAMDDIKEGVAVNFRDRLKRR
jgi:hypothetical protein